MEQTETDESSTAVGFRAAYVFDISQTDGQNFLTIPGNVNGDPRESPASASANCVTDQGIALHRILAGHCSGARHFRRRKDYIAARTVPR